jgi:hypothetical protein
MKESDMYDGDGPEDGAEEGQISVSEQNQGEWASNSLLLISWATHKAAVSSSSSAAGFTPFELLIHLFIDRPVADIL